MEFKYPVAKQDGKEYTAAELYSLLANEDSGYYLLSANQFWHGGVHFSDKTVSHCIKETPVQAIAKGVVIAYRINKDYLLISDNLVYSAENKEGFEYSSGFCLIKHQYKSPEQKPTTQETMDQWKDREIILQGKENGTRNARSIEGLELKADNDYVVSLKTGTKLEVVGVGNTVVDKYYFTQVKTQEALKGKNKLDKEVDVPIGTTLYLATFKADGTPATYKGDDNKQHDIFQENDTPEKWQNRLIVLNNATESYKDAQSTVLATLPAGTKIQLLEASNKTGALTKAKLLYDINVTPDSTATILEKDQELWVSLFDEKGQITKEDDKPIAEDTPTAKQSQYNFTYYSLYMHLCAYNDYLAKPEEEVAKKQTFTIKADDLSVREIYRGDEGKAIGTISNGATVEAEINADTLKTKGNITDLKAIIKSGTFTVKAGVTTTVKGVGDEIWVPIKQGDKSFIQEAMPELPKPPKEMTRPSYWEGTVTAKVKKADGLTIWKTLEGETLKEPIGDINVGSQFTFDSTQVKTITHNSKPTMIAECTPIGTLTFRKTGEQPTKFWTIVDTKASIIREKVDPTSFNTVVPCKAEITAGEALGYLGVYETPAPMCYFKKKRQVHIEVFTPDPQMVDFLLNNPLGLKDGKKFIRLPKGTGLFDKPVQQSPATSTTTTPQASYTLQRDHVFAIDDLTLEKDTDGTEWYLIGVEKHAGQVQKTENSPEIVNQHEWKKLGFQEVKENNPSADGYLDPKNMPAIFQEIYKKIDTSGDGKLQESELKEALKDPELREQWSKLIAYHPSEWKKDTAPLFARFEQLLTPPDGTPEDKKAEAKKLLEQEKERMGKLVFLEDITPSIPPLLYHFHPVAFIENISGNRHPIIYIDDKPIELDFLWFYDGSKITENDYVEAANKLGCEVAAIKAVAKTETGSSGSYFSFPKDDKVPAILFERHHFHKYTNGVYSAKNPDISNASAGGYGSTKIQYKKLLKAYNLDKVAALKSASWGMFQILGSNHVAAGYKTVEDFVMGISLSEKNHLKAFVNFIKADSRLSSSIVSKDWTKFAKAYNGPAQQGYDTKMEAHYNALTAK